ncbi:MAG: glutathione S-transferase C-terminal domain-containing protein [Acetobacteraceae bacterium]
MTDQPAFALYGFWRSSATFRVRVALALKGLSAQETMVDLEAGRAVRPGIPRHQPARRAGRPSSCRVTRRSRSRSRSWNIWRSATPRPPLLPSDPHGRARVRSLAALMASDTHPLIVPRVKKYLTGPGGFDDAAWRGWQVTWFSRGFQALEARLAGDPATGDFCHGDAPTMADICLASVVAVARVFKVQSPRHPDRGPHHGNLRRPSMPLPTPARCGRWARQG